MSRCLLLLTALLLGSASTTQAEIEHIATLSCDSGICLHWWPLLPKVAGWEHDRDASLSNDINVQVPAGSTFADAAAVIYAKASYKPRLPDVKSISALIENDKKDFLDVTPDIEITEVEPLFTKDGQAFKSFIYTPKSKGQWERVSYGEEDDFYLTFVVSARTMQGLEHVMSDYIRFISQYEKVPDSLNKHLY